MLLAQCICCAVVLGKASSQWYRIVVQINIDMELDSSTSKLYNIIILYLPRSIIYEDPNGLLCSLLCQNDQHGDAKNIIQLISREDIVMYVVHHSGLHPPRKLLALFI